MYKRVLLKLSGESLGGPAGKGLDTESLSAYAKEIAAAAKAGLQVAIVNGGGNIFRGLQGVGKGFDRVDGDKMGMLATVINSLALSMFIKEEGVDAQVFTATPMEPVAKYYMRDDAVKVLERGGVALIAGGTGNPFFTTDSGAALRASDGPDRLRPLLRRQHAHHRLRHERHRQPHQAHQGRKGRHPRASVGSHSHYGPPKHSLPRPGPVEWKHFIINCLYNYDCAK